MTGRIKNLSAGSASGFIESENGVRLVFDSCAVLAYDVTYLAVGQLVTFDLENGISPRAVNICVQRSHPVAQAEGKRKEITLRFVGFEQTKSIRGYKFERTAIGEETETFVVTTDMALFTKHHIGIQEGPALCLHLLVAELEAAGGANGVRLQCTLSERHMQAYLASRPVPGTRNHKRVPRPAAAVSHSV